ncbi:rod shape-determining protein MreC [Clostridia bacterium]|nr:rod shape-determining protein MreC [Clostridia bacterium]
MENRNKIIILFLLIACIVTVRLTSNDHDMTQMEKILAEGFRPMQEVLMQGTENLILFAEGVSNHPAVARENELLKSEIAQMKVEANMEREYYYENIRLRRLLGMREVSQQQFIAADIIARGIKSWDDTMTINMGELDGVALYDGVMTYNGLVGKVYQVSPHTAEVRLLNNKLGSVAAMTEQTRFPGVLEGIGDGSGLLQLIYLPHDAPVELNQTIITSGLGGLIPKGIKIGYISSIEYNPDGLLKSAIVTPFEDFDRLEEVLVVKFEGEVSP